MPKTSIPAPRWRLRRLGFPGIMGLWWAGQGLVHASWGPGVLAVGLGGAAVYGGGVAVVGRRRTGPLALTPTHLHTGSLAVPWGSIERVVRFSVSTGPLGDPPRLNFLGVRVGDFDNVRGLAPVRAGLANLTRRHLLILGEAGEMKGPVEVANAIECLVDRPETRLLLSGHEGVRLLTEGPPRGRRPW